MEKLIESAEQTKTILCFGIDPVMNRIKSEGGTEEKILNYYSEITDRLIEENQISAIKPNYAYFGQNGFEGLKTLKKITERYKNKIPIILDAKRGDIGRSSQAYADECYKFWDADAVTLSPYMGYDSVKPFIQEGKTAYILCRTSNPGGADFQELKFKGKFLYEHVAIKAAEWKTGIVVGATSTAIKRISKIIKGKNVPMLIPGVGTQGGDLGMILRYVKKLNPPMHRINSSSGIAYAYEKHGGNPAEAALKETKELNKKIRKVFS
ncbi:orotidine-5'-phosphate decarboxylase [Candidatus Micrarchaeota archaeon]|nr:orotidine-5'-phosphate decarboxylase [Candidatus Micrarchaeota archaeon]